MERREHERWQLWINLVAWSRLRHHMRLPGTLPAHRHLLQRHISTLRCSLLQQKSTETASAVQIPACFPTTPHLPASNLQALDEMWAVCMLQHGAETTDGHERQRD